MADKEKKKATPEQLAKVAQSYIVMRLTGNRHGIAMGGLIQVCHALGVPDIDATQYTVLRQKIEKAMRDIATSTEKADPKKLGLL